MEEERIRILLVEDDEIDRMAIERLAQNKQLPYDLMTSGTVADALELMRQGEWDLLLIDNRLPDGSGLEVQKEAHDIPCIFITGTSDQQTAVQAMKAGAYDFLLKDSERSYLELLPGMVQSALRRRKESAQIKLQQSIIDNLDELVLLMDQNGDVIYANNAVGRVLGYTPDEVRGAAWWSLMVDDETQRREMIAHVGEVIRGQKQATRYDLELRCRHGLIIWSAWNESCGPDGRLICVGRDITERKKLEKELGEHRDHLEKLVDERTSELSHTNELLRLEVSERKHAEEQLKLSLKEKEVLLQEVHHRVKNNMQVISSLLNLQSRKIKDNNLRAMFQESQNRVRSIALVHETLYHMKGLSYINLKEYFSKLARDLFRVYDVSPHTISVNVKAGDVALGIDLVAPCGLIINELISNSLKYAFPEGRRGVISLEADTVGEGEVVLVVRDNGVGMPEGFDVQKTETLGLKLVSLLVETQLRGKLEMKRENGTYFAIRFKQAPYRERI